MFQVGGPGCGLRSGDNSAGRAQAADQREQVTVNRADVDSSACAATWTIDFKPGLPEVMAQRMVGDH
jgi:hypothetical protein